MGLVLYVICSTRGWGPPSLDEGNGRRHVRQSKWKISSLSRVYICNTNILFVLFSLLLSDTGERCPVLLSWIHRMNTFLLVDFVSSDLIIELGIYLRNPYLLTTTLNPDKI